MGIRVVTLVREHGKEKAIRFLETHISNFLIGTRAHFEQLALLKKAKCLIEEGKLDELPPLDEQLKDLEDYDKYWD